MPNRAVWLVLSCGMGGWLGYLSLLRSRLFHAFGVGLREGALTGRRPLGLASLVARLFLDSCEIVSYGWCCPMA